MKKSFTNSPMKIGGIWDPKRDPIGGDSTGMLTPVGTLKKRLSNSQTSDDRKDSKIQQLGDKWGSHE